MKVKCKKIISPATKEDLGNDSPWLTLEKEYLVLAIAVKPKGVSILIQSDDHYEPIFPSLDGFEVIDQHTPSSWATKIDSFHDQTLYQMMPKSWMYDSFFDDVENEDPKAIALFNTEAEIMYREAGWVF